MLRSTCVPVREHDHSPLLVIFGREILGMDDVVSRVWRMNAGAKAKNAVIQVEFGSSIVSEEFITMSGCFSI